MSHERAWIRLALRDTLRELSRGKNLNDQRIITSKAIDSRRIGRTHGKCLRGFVTTWQTGRGCRCVCPTAASRTHPSVNLTPCVINCIFLDVTGVHLVSPHPVSPSSQGYSLFSNVSSPISSHVKIRGHSPGLSPDPDCVGPLERLRIENQVQRSILVRVDHWCPREN